MSFPSWKKSNTFLILFVCINLPEVFAFNCRPSFGRRPKQIEVRSIPDCLGVEVLVEFRPQLLHYDTVGQNLFLNRQRSHWVEGTVREKDPAANAFDQGLQRPGKKKRHTFRRIGRISKNGIKGSQ